MAPRVVYLHIGTTKTGTTFIQRVLWANQKSLEKNDVIMPAKGQYGFGRAARALHNWRPADEPIPGEWTAIADTINHSRKSSAFISQEFLCWLNQEQVNGLVRSLGQSQVKVIVTARDLARLIPAQWQSAMRQRNTWTLTEYAHGVQHGLDDSDGADGREPYDLGGVS